MSFLTRQQMYHIAAETVIVLGITIYLTKRLKSSESKIIELNSKIASYEDRLQKLESFVYENYKNTISVCQLPPKPVPQLQSPPKQIVQEVLPSEEIPELDIRRQNVPPVPPLPVPNIIGDIFNMITGVSGPISNIPIPQPLEKSDAQSTISDLDRELEKEFSELEEKTDAN